MARVFLGIGSNIKKEKNLRKCIALLKKKFSVKKISSVYETKPVGYENQDNFYNMVVEIETDLSPEKFLDVLMGIEKMLGRVRTKKNFPRTIDLDILFYEDRIIESKNLVIPHPRLHERAFVLVPLNEIAPDFVHPVLKKRIGLLLDELSKPKPLK